MNEKNHIGLIIALFAIAMSASFGAGYWFCHRANAGQAGSADNEFRAESEVKQRRIDELEARYNDLRSLVSDGVRDIGGTVERVSGYVDLALQQSSDIRATVSLIREAVKELENSERYFRELAVRLSDGKHNSGSE